MKNKGIASNQAVSLLDLFPTVLDLSGIEKPKFLEGTSLVPLLKDPNYVRKEPVLVTYEKGNVSARKNEWNFIQYIDGSEELYNHKSDPHEYRNIINNVENVAVVNELKSAVVNLKKNAKK